MEKVTSEELRISVLRDSKVFESRMRKEAALAVIGDDITEIQGKIAVVMGEVYEVVDSAEEAADILFEKGGEAVVIPQVDGRVLPELTEDDMEQAA